MIFNFTKTVLFQRQARSNIITLRSTVVFLMFTITTITAKAQIATWTGAADATWENAANWNPANVPLATDDIIIPDVSPNSGPSIANLTVVRSIEIQSGGQLTINQGVTLRIDGSPNIGILNNGNVINNGRLELGNTSSASAAIPIGITNNSSFTNTSTATISIQRVGTAGDPNTIVIQNNGQFINEGQITAFNNVATAIVIDQMGTFTNSGNISLFNNNDPISLVINNGSLINQFDGSIGFLGGQPIIIEADGILDNQTCAAFGHTNGFVNNGGQITNSGFLSFDFYRLFESALPVPSVNTGAVINTAPGIIFFSSTPTLTSESNPINNTGAILEEFVPVEIPVSCSAAPSYSPFLNFDPGDLTIGIFSDQSGSTSAGTFDNATNTFIPNDPTQTNFFITIENPDCSILLPIPTPYSIVFLDPDTDGDGVLDCDDLCLDTPVNETTNADGCACSQLTVDDNDPCTEDTCEAGIVTTDGDLTCDADDGCPNNPNKIAPGICGCEVSDEDLDMDGITDCIDLCLGTPNGEATNQDGCACSQLTVDDNDPCTEDTCDRYQYLSRRRW